MTECELFSAFINCKKKVSDAIEWKKLKYVNK